MTKKKARSDYAAIFNDRGNSYNRATQLCPEARTTERNLLIEYLDLKPHHTVCDVPSGGAFLADGLLNVIADPSQITCVEPADAFREGIDPKFRKLSSELGAIDLENESVDRVGSLAGLHHVEPKSVFFDEAARILRPGGKLAVADVRTGTPVAGFLNDSVDRYTETGHRGIFLADGEFTALLASSGFVDVVEQFSPFSWDFPDKDTMILFCKKLFGMHKADLSVVEREVFKYFDPITDDDGTHLPWSLIYAVGTKQ